MPFFELPQPEKPLPGMLVVGDLSLEDQFRQEAAADDASPPVLEPLAKAAVLAEVAIQKGSAQTQTGTANTTQPE